MSDDEQPLAFCSRWVSITLFQHFLADLHVLFISWDPLLLFAHQLSQDWMEKWSLGPPSTWDQAATGSFSRGATKMRVAARRSSGSKRGGKKQGYLQSDRSGAYTKEKGVSPPKCCSVNRAHTIPGIWSFSPPTTGKPLCCIGFLSLCPLCMNDQIFWMIFIIRSW